MWLLACRAELRVVSTSELTEVQSLRRVDVAFSMLCAVYMWYLACCTELGVVSTYKLAEVQSLRHVDVAFSMLF